MPKWLPASKTSVYALTFLENQFLIHVIRSSSYFILLQHFNIVLPLGKYRRRSEHTCEKILGRKIGVSPQKLLQILENREPNGEHALQLGNTSCTQYHITNTVPLYQVQWPKPAATSTHHQHAPTRGQGLWSHPAGHLWGHTTLSQEILDTPGKVCFPMLEQSTLEGWFVLAKAVGWQPCLATGHVISYFHSFQCSLYFRSYLDKLFWIQPLPEENREVGGERWILDITTR